MAEDPEITITMPRSQWEAVLANEPMAKETYTDSGVLIFNAFQKIRNIVDPIASKA